MLFSIKKISAFLFLFLLFWVGVQPNLNAQTTQEKSVSKPLKSKEVLITMEKVALWQLNDWRLKGPRWPLWDWTNGACYTGILAISEISKNPIYEQRLIEIGESLNWNTGPRRFFADDYCIGQTYAILYKKYKNPKMIANWQKLADSIIAKPNNESLEWKNKIQNREWAWCDALFMGPTALAYLSSATGDQKYLDIANKLFWKTTDYLYDPEEQLYFRDASFFNKKEKNGRKVFWSRGNGWVMGGIVRILENMPENYPYRKKYEVLFQEMASKIITLQQADGSWHASLLDPNNYNIKETSGTGFYCYALLWGMNNGLLSKSETWPVVKKAWGALSSSVKEDGKLGYVQPIGASPDKVDENSTEVYGTGSFLLAGSELYKFIKSNKQIAK
jgi:rhamnogalacturonyl hydrolase YesR